MDSNLQTKGSYTYLGKPRKIIDGLEKVTGYAQFTGDVHLVNMAYARPIFSPYAHAKIVEIDKSEAESMPGVVAVLTAADLPTAERVINSRNSAVLAKERVLWAGQPVAIVVAETESQAADAAEMVFIDYDPIDAAVDMDDALTYSVPTIWPNGMPQEGEGLESLHGDQVEGDAVDEKEGFNNILNENHFSRGDVEAGFAESDLILEGTYKTPIIHQIYLEPHAVTVDPDPLGRGVTIYTSTQGMYGVRDEVARLLSLPKHQVTVIPMVVGGGFGAKYGIYEPLVAATAMATRRPIRLVLSRSEDFLSTTPAPQIKIEVKAGVKNDGTLTSIEARAFTDNGPFSFTHGGIIATAIGGTYDWQATKVDTYEVNTNKTPIGAYRAPGVPQAIFAIESIIDDMAAKLDIDPLEIRLKNVVSDAGFTGTGRKWPVGIGSREVLEETAKHPLWQERHNLKPNEGIGIALGAWPSANGTSEAVCRVDTDGRVRVNIGIVDISGSKSSFVLVAAEVLGVDPDMVEIVQDDTTGSYGPNSGGSQVTYSVAGAVEAAAVSVKQQLLEVASDHFEAAPEDIELANAHAQVIGVPDKKIHIGRLSQLARNKSGGAGPVVGEGTDAPPVNAPGFVVEISKVRVDPETGEITPLKHVTIQDVGFALNPMLVEGQIHGGSLQSVGMGLYEAMVYDENGTLLTGSFMDYGVPRIDNSPELEAVLVENPSPEGPFGARGVGEPSVTAGAAAVANAVKHATGVRVAEIPIRAESFWRAKQNQN